MDGNTTRPYCSPSTSDNVETRHHLRANFETETLCYYHRKRNDGDDDGDKEEDECEERDSTTRCYETFAVPITSAMSTRGGNIVDEQQDSTGIMLWPASHWLCQHVVWNYAGYDHRDDDPKKKKKKKMANRVVELGCGCGVVGVTMSLCRAADVIICTDMEPDALSLCRQNLVRNGLLVTVAVGSSSASVSEKEATKKTFVTESPLSWGNRRDIDHVLSLLRQHSSSTNDNSSATNCKADLVIGADIVYPATSGAVLDLLFETVDALLEDNEEEDDDDSGGSMLLLSFVSRDGHRTPQLLLEAASRAGFAVSPYHHHQLRLDQSETPSCVLEDDDLPVTPLLPPMMGAKLLRFTRAADGHAKVHNDHLGGEDCAVFPGLRKQITEAALRREEPQEVWEPPYCDYEFED